MTPRRDSYAMGEGEVSDHGDPFPAHQESLCRNPDSSGKGHGSSGWNYPCKSGHILDTRAHFHYRGPSPDLKQFTKLLFQIVITYYILFYGQPTTPNPTHFS